VFGVVKHGRRKRGRGRPKRDRLKPPPGLLVGVVNPFDYAQGEMADPSGRVCQVRRSALFGRLRDIRSLIGQLGLGTDVNTSHVERFNGTSP